MAGIFGQTLRRQGEVDRVEGRCTPAKCQFPAGLVAVFGFLALSLAALPGAVAAAELQATGPRPEIRFVLPVGETDREEDEIDGTSVDNQGNTIIAGVFYDEVRLAGKMYRSRGAGDIFLASIAPNGAYRWVRQFGAGADDNAYDVTTDAAGNIYMSGWFSRQVDFGGTTLRARGGTDMFVAKYTSAGQLIWARAFGGAAGDGGNEISVTDAGEIAVSAITGGDFTADGRTYRFGGGGRDSLVVRMTTAGQIRWITPIAGPGMERIRAIELAESGDVYLGFQYRGSVTMGGLRVSAVGDWDGAMARIRPDGRPAWLKNVGAGGLDNLRGIGVAPDGSVYGSGVLSGNGTVLDRRVTGITGNTDYVVRVGSDGRVAWMMLFQGARNASGAELVVDAKGVILSGLLVGGVEVRRDGRAVATIRPPNRLPTAYLAAFTHQGALRFAYTPTPAARGSRGNGAVLAVSRNGRWLAQSIRFRGAVDVAGRRVTGPSRKDSAILLMQLNGA